jgi:CDP-6-deoxy-D-xylo-4-hexulose-3-dehydrase
MAPPTAEDILAQVAEYAAHRHTPAPFDPLKPSVPVSGKVFGPEEVVELVRSSLDFWLTSGPETKGFERALARRAGVRHALMVNSGSSANLLAVATLCSPALGERQLRPGDEVITVAAGFPTTVNPLVQHGLVPVFVDIALPSYNIDVSRLDEALSPRTRAVVIAHTLGNPFDLQAVQAFCKRHNLFLIEDCCDALGASYRGEPVGTFGDLATLSFYPAHQITTGEGGAVLMQRAALRRVAESIRDWGRDCWCDTGCDNTCGKRFSQQHGTLPPGYDHKYVYSEIGYNLKATDL